jgi:hypothetical protein
VLRIIQIMQSRARLSVQMGNNVTNKKNKKNKKK